MGLQVTRTLVAALPEDRENTMIASTVAALCSDLGLICVGEGMESAAQAAFLLGPRLPRRSRLPVQPAGRRRDGRADAASGGPRGVGRHGRRWSGDDPLTRACRASLGCGAAEPETPGKKIPAGALLEGVGRRRGSQGEECSGLLLSRRTAARRLDTVLLGVSGTAEALEREGRNARFPARPSRRWRRA